MHKKLINYLPKILYTSVIYFSTLLILSTNSSLERNPSKVKHSVNLEFSVILLEVASQYNSLTCNNNAYTYNSLNGFNYNYV